MRINGHKINDVGLSVGVGIPIKMQGFSSVNLGLTWGCRGTTATGMIGTRQFRMVRENYIKVSIGLSLFGEGFEPMLLSIMAPGGFLVFGLVLGVANYFMNKAEKKKTEEKGVIRA